MFWVFWPRGMWDLTFSTRDGTCTPCPGRPNRNHQGSPSDLNLSECVKNVLGQKSIVWTAEKYISKNFQKMCAGHKPGLAELQTFYKFFFSISFFFFNHKNLNYSWLTWFFKTNQRFTFSSRFTKNDYFDMLTYFFQIPFRFLVQFFVNWQLNAVKLWKDISNDYPSNYFGNCTCQKAKMQSHTKKKRQTHFIIRLNSLLSLEYSRFTWWSCTSQIMAEAGVWSQQRQATYASIRRVWFLTWINFFFFYSSGFSTIDMSFLVSVWTFVLKMTSYCETI